MDQWRALSDYRDFFGYMDYHNVDFTIPINVTETIGAVAEIIADSTGAPNVIELGQDLKKDLTVLFDFSRLVEQTPVADFTKNIDWDGL